MKPVRVELEGVLYALLPWSDLERLQRLAAVGAAPSPPHATNRPASQERAYFAREVKRRRAKLAVSQRDLAREAGIRFESLNRIERGRSAPTLESVAAIEDALARLEGGKRTEVATPWFAMLEGALRAGDEGAADMAEAKLHELGIVVAWRR